MQIDGQRRGAILAAYGGVCHYCGAPATEVDHIVSQDAGGSDDLENLIAACRPCNAGKCHRRLAPDAESRALAAAAAMRETVLKLEVSRKFVVRITVQLDPGLTEKLDDWRRNQPDLPPRAVAMRILAKRGLDAP